MKVKFSVIIPVYNIQDYIAEAISSILKQSCNSYEIILVNDGSTDNSADICDQFAKKYPNIKVIYKSNGGLSSARNYGINAARGEYLFFLDGDDFITLDALESFENIADDGNSPDLICGKFIKYYNENKKYEEKFNFDIRKINNKKGIEVLNYFFEEIPSIMWSACRTVYRRQFIIDNAFYFKEGITTEDLELIPRIYIRAESVSTCNKPFYYYRQSRPNSIINTVNKKRFYDLVQIIDAHLELIQGMNGNREFKIKFLKQLANIYSRYIVIIGEVSKEDRKEVIEEMLKLKNILKYANGFRGRYVKLSVEVFGINFTYSFYSKVKRLIINLSSILKRF